MKLAALAVLIAAMTIAAGCGSSGPKSNGESAKTFAQVLADTLAAANQATSVHISGSGSQGGTALDIDLYLVAGKGGRGHLNVNGLSFDVIRIGSTAYFKGGAKFWSKFGGSVAGQLLKGRWLSEPSGKGDLASLASLTDIATFFKALTRDGPLTKGATTTVNGQSVIPLVDPSQKGILYVSATGSPYPVELVNTGGKGTIAFGEWNQPVTLAAPANSIDISKLKAAGG